MGDWEIGMKLEREAKLVEAQAELAKTDPKTMQVALEAKRICVEEATVKAEATVRKLQAAALKRLADRAPFLLTNIVWATVAVAICWILVVMGWRG